MDAVAVLVQPTIPFCMEVAVALPSGVPLPLRLGQLCIVVVAVVFVVIVLFLVHSLPQVITARMRVSNSLHLVHPVVDELMKLLR